MLHDAHARPAADYRPRTDRVLWAFLDSEAGYALVRRLPYGGSIPHIDESFMRGVPVPLMGVSEMKLISRNVLGALKGRDQALDLEREARRTVERFIEGTDL
jgi:type I restriction enzyme, S subunit